MKNFIRLFFVLTIVTLGSLNAHAQNGFGNTTIVWNVDPVIPCELPDLIFEGHNSTGTMSFDPHNPGVLPLFDDISVGTAPHVSPFYFKNILPGTVSKMIFCCNGERLLVRVRFDHNYTGSGSNQILSGATITITVQIRPGDCPPE